jgi:hypothetical protein
MTSWFDSAACKGKPWQWFFHGDEGLVLCADCPVRVECLEYALAFETRAGLLPGIYGGCTERQRSAIRRRRGVPGVGPGAVTLPAARSGQPAKHGTEQAYRVHGCRCAECVDVARAAFRRRKHAVAS